MIKQGKNAALEIRRRENFVRAFDEDVTLWRNLMRLLLITALVVAAAGPALAQSDFPDPPMPQMSGDQAGPRMGMMRPPERETLAEMQARTGRLFDRLDANHDGVIDAAELANARGGRMLTRFDAAISARCPALSSGKP